MQLPALVIRWYLYPITRPAVKQNFRGTEAMKSETELTPSEAAQRLQIGMQRLYDLLHSGKLRAVKRGTRWAIPESAIVERQFRVQQFAQLQGTGHARK